MKLTIKLFMAIVLIISFVALYIEISSGDTKPIKDSMGNDIPESVALLEKVKIGGMDQWIQARGENVANPVLLWLHGGPGAAQMPIAHYFNGDLESDFIVVHWDQRGAGKSNPRNFDEQTMTFERFVADAHELTVYLKNRFKKDKIYLLGHSWGSHLGIKLAQKYPEDYYAYVAVSQLVDPLRGQEVGYTWLKERISSEGNQKDLSQLELLGMPPYTEHNDFVAFAGLIGKYGGNMDVGMGKLAMIALRAPEYGIRDYAAWLQGATRGSGPMWESTQSFDVIKEVPELSLPVYFISGKKDRNTPLLLVEEYFNILDAPEGKEVIAFEESAHMPFMKEPDKFNHEIINIKNETYIK